MRTVLDARALHVELSRVLGEPAHLRPSLTLVVLQLEEQGSSGPAAAGERSLLESLASVAAERLRKVDVVALLDDRTLAVLLVGASPGAAESVVAGLEELLRPLLADDALAHGLSGAFDGIDGVTLVAAARADLQRRAERRELTRL